MKQDMTMFKRKIIKARSLLRSKDRYKGDQEQYKCMLCQIGDFYVKTGDDEYLNFILDLLREEVRYCSYLELFRGREQYRYLYPFMKMDSELLGYSYSVEKKIDIDLSITPIVSEPWDKERHSRIFRKMVADKEFVYEPNNHKAIYFEYLDIACMCNGYHSTSIGGYLKKGSITANVYETPSIFDSVIVNDDLSISYDADNISKRFAEKNEPVPENFDEKMRCRYIGVDYRLLLIYELSKMKLKHQITKENVMLRNDNFDLKRQVADLKLQLEKKTEDERSIRDHHKNTISERDEYEEKL